MGSCCVPGCSNYSKKTGEEVSYHQFPPDEGMARQGEMHEYATSQKLFRDQVLFSVNRKRVLKILTLLTKVRHEDTGNVVAFNVIQVSEVSSSSAMEKEEFPHCVHNL